MAHLLNLLGQFTSGREDECLSLSHLSIQRLKNRDGEGSSLTSTRLGLCNHVATLNILFEERTYDRK